MNSHDSGQTVARLIDSFIDAPPDRQEAEYQRLLASLWDDGKLTELALPAAREIVRRLESVDDERKGHLAILLGLLAEAEYPATDGEVTAAARRGLDPCLELWRRTVKGQPLSLALQYLLSHFPGDRDRILAVADELGIDVDDRSRLDRALQRLDPANPVIGRAFPYPTAWEMDEAEREFDRAWIKSLRPEQVERQWHDDTSTVLGYTGAKAYWAVRHGAPTAVLPDSLPPRYPRPEDADVSIFQRHAAIFRCPDCHGRLAISEDAARCGNCSAVYPFAKGMLNLLAGQGGDADRDFLFQLSKMGSMGFYAEAFARPNFKRLCGYTWDGPVSPEYEDEYIASHAWPADGPVLDLAAGAGGCTRTLVSTVGEERVIALDLVPAMLASLRERLPRVPAVIANAINLPFDDATLAAVMCWNGPHAFLADAEAAFAEVGRCLRPGGTLVLYTFRNSDDPVYRYFVASHHFPQHSHGLRMFDLAELKEWLAKAGLTIRQESGPGLAVFLVAEKTG
jgi:SAM-dependent methyltransferase